MGELTAVDAGTIAEAARLSGMLPYLEQYIDKLEHTLETKIYQKLDKGELTPDQALFAWQEKLILRRLIRHFTHQTRIGQTIASEHIEELG